MFLQLCCWALTSSWLLRWVSGGYMFSVLLGVTNQPIFIPHCDFPSTVTLRHFISCVSRYLSQPFYSNSILELYLFSQHDERPRHNNVKYPCKDELCKWYNIKYPYFMEEEWGGWTLDFSSWRTFGICLRSAKRYIARFHVLVAVGFLEDLSWNKVLWRHQIIWTTNFT